MAIEADFFSHPIKLSPHFSERPWGGRNLKNVLKKQLPESDTPIGESWELSDHPSGRSTVVAPGTKANGATFGELLRSYPRQMIGRDSAPDRYPLLIKYIDATGDLSVQVHPDDAWCQANNHDDRGKSECWYVMSCQPGTQLIHGYREGASEEYARKALENNDLGALLQFKDVDAGDFLAVPPKTVHAMLSGLMVCEIQQSSNTTFRLYDWGRQPARELHIDQSMEVTEWDASKVPPIKKLGLGTAVEPEVNDLLSNEFFKVTAIDVPIDNEWNAEELLFETGSIINVVSGGGFLAGKDWEEELHLGQTLFLPAEMRGPLVLRAGDQGIRILHTISKEL